MVDGSWKLYKTTIRKDKTKAKKNQIEESRSLNWIRLKCELCIIIHQTTTKEHKSLQCNALSKWKKKFFVFKIFCWRLQTIYLDLKYPKKCEQTDTMDCAWKKGMRTRERHKNKMDEMTKDLRDHRTMWYK